MNQIVIGELLNIAQRHRQQLEHLRLKLSSHEALTTEVVEMFSANDIALWDAFIMRFCMLQDLMGSKLFDAFLSWAGHTTATMTIIDKIYVLEKMEIIEDSELWRSIRETRNKLTHEYPNAPILAAKLLNETIVQIDFLFQIMDAIDKRVKR